MVPQQFELLENEQQRIGVVGGVDAVELAALAAEPDEWADACDALRGAGDGGDAPFEPRFGATDGGALGLRRGGARGHDRGHLRMIGAAETDLGAEGAADSVANDDAERAGR